VAREAQVERLSHRIFHSKRLSRLRQRRFDTAAHAADPRRYSRASLCRLGLAWLAKCRPDAAAAVGAGLRLCSPESAQLVQDVVQRLVRPKAGRTRQRCAAVVVRRHKLRTQIRCRHLSLCADQHRSVPMGAALRCAVLRIVAARSTGTPAQFRQRGNAVDRLSAQVGGSNCRALSPAGQH
jgi:hypothetical protein